jgi:hypothetical protein
LETDAGILDAIALYWSQPGNKRGKAGRGSPAKTAQVERLFFRKLLILIHRIFKNRSS